MKDFAKLFAELDQTNKTNAKVALLKKYFENAPDADKCWVLALFTHKRPRRQVRMSLVREWAAHKAGISPWLFDETYHIVGDLAETIAMILPPPTRTHHLTLAEWVDFIRGLGENDEQVLQQKLFDAWDRLNEQERFIFIKLLTGGFRIGISQNLIVRAVAEATGVDKAVVAHRIMGNWEAGVISFQELILDENRHNDQSKPYPFCLAHPLEGEPEALGIPEEWSAEWKWDGIRGQVIVRKGECFVWSRGEELLTDKFPEFDHFPAFLPAGTVMDGEILCFENGMPKPFADLQTRIGRKNITRKVLQDAPVVFMAYDLLEHKGRDCRNLPFAERRTALTQLLADTKTPNLVLSPQVVFQTWEELITTRVLSRDHAAEGLMLKRQTSAYHAGRRRGDWWKWKVEPLAIDAVLIYAQKGHGRRAGLYTDYTFGVWHEGELVVFAKAYSGLTDAEFREVDAFIKKNTLEKFGPVRTVKPELVFEIGFEGIQRSNRHKSGVAVRFPRMLRWRKDKQVHEADTLAQLKQLLLAAGI
jgi:DNA ligase-1